MSKGKKDKLDLTVALNNVLNDIIVQDPQQIFYLPVDTKLFFDYTKKIAKPMDLQTMQKKIKKYVGYKEFENDLNLIWSNCRIYNQENSDIYKASLRLERLSKKSLKEHLLPFKAHFRFDENGVPIKKRKYNRVKDSLNSSMIQTNGNQNYFYSSPSGIPSRKASLTADKKEKRGSKGVAKLAKAIKKGKKQDLMGLKKAQQLPALSQHLIFDKKAVIHPPKSTNYNCIVIGLQQQIQSKENLITEDDKQFLKQKVVNFSQEELFKCIKTIQEYEPQHISQQSKEHYTVNFNTLTKMVFNKIKEQFSL
ncbi:hypothetical protein ABPG74_003536 [Tetrahymena malaccensis]